MEIIKGKKYKIHLFGFQSSVLTVKVTNLFSKTDGSEWVEWRWNMPLPIYEVTELKRFTEWVLTEK
jgi:hypothetical protein